MNRFFYQNRGNYEKLNLKDGSIFRISAINSFEFES
jgi:hypothetical protein